VGFLGCTDITGRLASIVGRICRSPLSVYTLDAIADVQRYSSGDYHCVSYPTPSTVTISTGLIGVLHMNCLVNMNLDDDVNRPNIALRDIRDEQMGFLCMGHTSHSVEAGSIRRLSRGVEVRLWKLSEWESFVECVLKCLTEEGKSDDNARVPSPCLLMIEGMYRYITPRCLELLRKRFLDGSMMSATMRMETLDLDCEELTVMHIGISPGALIRREDGWAYDSVTVEYWKGLEEYSRILEKTPDTHMSMYFSIVPFLNYNRPPRTLISSVQALQAMCHPVLYTSLVHVPLNVSSPLVTTEFSKKILGKDTYLIPGENACILLMNLNDNYEDCFILSHRCVKERLFSYKEVATVAVDTEDQVKAGDIISMKTHKWWYIPFDATVKAVRYDAKHRLLLTLERDADITDGDKLATMHGQKGVVKILPANSIPYGIDEKGTRIDFDLIVSVSSVLSRLTVGQVLELQAGRIAMKRGWSITCEEYMEIQRSKGRRLVETDPIGVYDPDTNECYVRRNADGTSHSMKCKWGYGRVFLLKHLTTNTTSHAWSLRG
jgi:hypothetical protein